MVKAALELKESYGFGIGYGSGDGSGYGSGDGDGSGYGSGYGTTYGFGIGSGYGSGDGDGSGYSSGHVYDDSYGYGSGYGYGYGDSYGSGYGYGDLVIFRQFLMEVRESLVGQDALKLDNQELKRVMIEIMGADRFFKELKCKIVHQDIDVQGHERQLLRIPVDGTSTGYLQAVKVVCPTSGRVYHLGVPPDVKTCQEAVASTFKLKANEYKPRRES